MQVQVVLDLIEVPQGELWEFAQVVPKSSRIELHYAFEEGYRWNSDWEVQEIELLAQWSEAPNLVSKSATIDLLDGDRLIEAIRALVDDTPENASFEPIVAAYDPENELPLERLSPRHCLLKASWEQDPTVPLLEL